MLRLALVGGPLVSQSASYFFVDQSVSLLLRMDGL